METYNLSASVQQANYFKTFVKSLVEKFRPLKLFCFAKTNLLSETNGCFRDQAISHHCDYCLLLVTETRARIDHEVQEFANIRYRNGNVSIICHGQESILEAIKANSRFFITVYTTGELLYSQDGMSHFDFTEKFIPTQAANNALKHFNHRMPLVEGFLRGATECLAKRDFRVSTFMLHQVVEQCCILLIRIHLAYRSEVHNLLRMLRLCSSFSDKPIKTFLSGSKEDERLFDLLMRSYSGSRYGSSYSISDHDAQSLFERVSFFVDLIKDMCSKKIEELEHEELFYKKLNGEGEVKNGY